MRACVLAIRSCLFKFVFVCLFVCIHLCVCVCVCVHVGVCVFVRECAVSMHMSFYLRMSMCKRKIVYLCVC